MSGRGRWALKNEGYTYDQPCSSASTVPTGRLAPLHDPLLHVSRPALSASATISLDALYPLTYGDGLRPQEHCLVFLWRTQDVG